MIRVDQGKPGRAAHEAALQRKDTAPTVTEIRQYPAKVGQHPVYERLLDDYPRELEMNFSEIADRLQLVASIGVIIGLILVIYEIRETNRIAENQAAIDMGALYSEWTILMTDENMARLFVKSLESPDALSPDELLRLHYMYFTASQTFRTGHFLRQTGGLSLYPESTLYDDASAAFSGPVAKRWVAMIQDGPDEISALMRQAAQDTPPEARLQFLESMRPPAEN